MKKMFTGVVMAIAISTTANAQHVDSVTYNGLVMTLHCHKDGSIICRPQKAGYIDSNQVKVSHMYKYTAHTEFHSKSAYEKYSETLSEKRVKASAEVSTTIEYEPVSASAKTAYESEYLDKLMTTVKNSQEDAKDESNDVTQEMQIEYGPN